MNAGWLTYGTHFALILGVLWSFAPRPAPAQTYIEKTYSLETGFPQPGVFSVYQDTRGYLWFGGSGRVSRYDGRHFRSFPFHGGVSGPAVRSLAEDGEGRLWVATPEGLYILSGDALTALDDSAALLSSTVHDLAGLPSGDVWIATAAGLSRHDGETVSHITTVDGLPSADVRSLAVDPKGRLWAGTAGGLCLVEPAELRCYSVAEGLPDSTVTTVMADRKGRIWAGTPKGIGLLLDTRRRGRAIALDHLPPVPVNALLQDRSGTFWIASDSSLFRLDQNLAVSHHWEGSSWQAGALLEDHEGSIWAGLGRRGAVQLVQTAFRNPAAYGELPAQSYTHLHQAPDSTLWLGTSSDGLYRIDGDEVTAYRLSQHPYLEDIRTIQTAPDGTVWIGAGDGLVSFDGRSFSRVFSSDSLLSAPPTALLAGSILWVGNTHGVHGVRSDTTHHLRLGPHTPTALYRHRGHLWIGTHNGLYAFDENESGLTHLLAHYPISTITAGASGDLWLGTAGYGVLRFDPDAASVVDTLDARHGLQGASVTFTQFDRNGTLWIGTTKGIHRLDGEAYRNGGFRQVRAFPEFEYFTSSTGVPQSVLSDYRGRLWFGTNQGLLAYALEEESARALPPPVAVTSIRSRWQPEPGVPSPSSGSPIRFTHRDTDIALTVQGFSFLAPDQLRYSYRLEGLEPAWSPITAQARVVFNDLAPGAYTFQVRAQNREGHWSTRPATVHFVIAPPFWQAGWFAWSVLGGACILLYVIASVRTRARAKREAQIEEQVAARTQHIEEAGAALLQAREEELQTARERSVFLSAMAHEALSSMEGIQGLVHLVASTEMNEEQSRYADTLFDSGQALLELIDNAVTFADVAAGTLILEQTTFDVQELLEASLKSIQHKASAKGLGIRTFVSPEVPPQIQGYRNQTGQILKHLLSNAVKYTDSGLIFLEVRRSGEANGRLVFSVYDTGIGIDAKKLSHLFDELKRGAAFGTRTFTGGGIGLTLAHQMSQLLGGSLSAESSPGIGSTFRVAVPYAAGVVAPSEEAVDPLHGKRVLISLLSGQDRRRLDVLCRSLGLTPDYAAPSALLGDLPGVHVVIADTHVSSAPELDGRVPCLIYAGDGEAPALDHDHVLYGPPDVSDLEEVLRDILDAHITV